MDVTTRKHLKQREISTVAQRIQSRQLRTNLQRNQLFLQNRNLNDLNATPEKTPDRVKSWRTKKNEAKIQEYIQKRSPFISVVPVGRIIEKKKKVTISKTDLNDPSVKEFIASTRNLTFSKVLQTVEKTHSKPLDNKATETKKKPLKLQFDNVKAEAPTFKRVFKFAAKKEKAAATVVKPIQTRAKQEAAQEESSTNKENDDPEPLDRTFEVLPTDLDETGVDPIALTPDRRLDVEEEEENLIDEAAAVVIEAKSEAPTISTVEEEENIFDEAVAIVVEAKSEAPLTSTVEEDENLLDDAAANVIEVKPEGPTTSAVEEEEILFDEAAALVIEAKPEAPSTSTVEDDENLLDEAAAIVVEAQPEAKAKAPTTSTVDELFVSSPANQITQPDSKVSRRKKWSKTYKLYSSSSDNQKRFLESVATEHPHKLEIASKAQSLILKLDDFDDILRHFEFPTSPSKTITAEDIADKWDDLYDEIGVFRRFFDSVKHLLEPQDEMNYSVSGTPVRRSMRIVEKKRDSCCFGCTPVSNARKSVAATPRRRTAKKSVLFFDETGLNQTPPAKSHKKTQGRKMI